MNNFKWTDELVQDFAEQYRFSSSRISLEQFKASREKKEWEIVAFSKNGTICNLIEDWQTNGNWTQPMFRGGTNQFSLAFGLDETTNCTIHSVRRLSDRDVATVGDKSKYRTGAIKKIVIDGEYEGGVRLEFDDEDPLSLWAFQKLLSPLFVTADGVEIRKGDTYYQVNEDWTTSGFEVINELCSYGKTGLTHFSKYDLALQWLTENKPCLSIKEVREVFEKHFYRPYYERFSSELTDLVKSKING